MTDSSLAKVLTWIDTISGHEARIELKEDSLLKTKSLKFVQKLRQELEEVAIVCEESLTNTTKEPDLYNYLRKVYRLESIANINFEDYDDWDWFQLVKDGDFAKVDILIWLGRDVNSADKFDTSALQWASMNGNIEVVRVLLDNEATIDYSGGSTCTSLYLASSANHIESVRLLIDRGANVDAVDKNGDSALHIASEHGHLEIARLLLNGGVNVNLVNKYNHTPLYNATNNADVEMVKLLIENRADLNMVAQLFIRLVITSRIR
jgi:ankyrin repeat protein